MLTRRASKIPQLAPPSCTAFGSADSQLVGRGRAGGSAVALSLLGALSLLSACSSSGDAPEVEARAAGVDECPAGGTVLLVDGEVQATVCNGRDGDTGPAGVPGTPGVMGEPGQNATSDGVIRDTLFCTLDDAETFVSLYLWRIDGTSEAFDNVGLCRLGEGAFSDTVPLIGTRCSMVSPAKQEPVEIELGADAASATVSGAMTGAMDCGS